MSRTLSLKPSYYEALKRLTIELVGVKLGEDHAFLVETKLLALARREGFENLSQMIEELFSQGQTRLAIHVVTTLLERATSFFESRKGFEIIGDVLLPSLHRIYRGGTVRILSYGCSTGQEVYSAAILADTFADIFPDMHIELTGVDYPSQALERAKSGRFTHFEVQRGLPIRHLIKYFDRDGEDWVVKESLSSKITFIDHNLLSEISDLGTYHIVLFRGHLNQITSPAKARILRILSSLVSTHGYLMLDYNENPGDMNYWFDPVSIAPGCFKKREKQAQGPGPTLTPAQGQVHAQQSTVDKAQQQVFVPVENKGRGSR